MAQAYDDLLNNVRNQNSVEASVTTLIQGILSENQRLAEENAQLRKEKGRDEAEGDPPLHEQIGGDHKALSEAVMANTPAGIAPPANEQEAWRREEDDRRRQEDEDAQRRRDEEDPAHASLRAPINTSATSDGTGAQDPTITRPAEHGTREGLPG